MYDANSPDFAISLLEIPTLLQNIADVLATAAAATCADRGSIGSLDSTRKAILPLRVADPNSWPQMVPSVFRGYGGNESQAKSRGCL